MVDPKVSSEFFADFGAMRSDVKTIKESVAGPNGLAARVGELEVESRTNTGRKLERREKGALLLSFFGTGVLLAKELYSYLAGKH